MAGVLSSDGTDNTLQSSAAEGSKDILVTYSDDDQAHINLAAVSDFASRLVLPLSLVSPDSLI